MHERTKAFAVMVSQVHLISNLLQQSLYQENTSLGTSM